MSPIQHTQTSPRAASSAAFTLLDADEQAALSRRAVAVLRGGRSSEREVSLRSGEAILGALRSAMATGARPGPANVLDIECRADGLWQRDGVASAPGACLASIDPSTLFLLALHGGEGENGTVQGLLEAHGRVYTGSGVGASALCMNKHATRLVLQSAGLTVAPARLIHPGEWQAHPSSALQEVRALSRQGWSVKPNCGGSSVSTFLVATEAELEPAIEAVLDTGDRVLVERRILGVEATCGVLGNERGRLRPLTPVEIVPHAGRFFDYEEKYSAGGADEYCPPRGISPRTCARIQELSCIAHRAAGCDGYSRIDYIVPVDTSGATSVDTSGSRSHASSGESSSGRRGERPADGRSASSRGWGQEGEPIVLEINTLPGMTARSLMPRAAAAEGVSLRDLLLEILGLALARAGAKP